MDVRSLYQQYQRKGKEKGFYVLTRKEFRKKVLPLIQVLDPVEWLQEFKETKNPLDTFISENLESSPVPIPSSVVYAGYLAWCTDSGNKPISKNRLSRAVNNAYGLGRSVRNMATGKVESGVMARLKG